jgi:WD40 repeat protein/tetratricopeptide (TPR) repeat protein
MNITKPERPNPFPGLRPFRSDEHHLFFGREKQTGALLQLLRTNRFLAVVGTSGSGKSSLVRAGMIAELHGGTMTQAGSTWEVMILRPGGSPIENLARAFVEADLYDPEDPSTLPRLLATLNRSRFGLVEAMKQCELFEPGTNLLVVVDQFEELFRFRQQGVDSEETAAAFVNLLLTASEQAERPIYVTITMRSDYLGDCSEIPGLAEAVNDGEYLIPRLLRDQKRDAIEKPVGVGGAKISPMLVQRLLNDVGDDPDQLPVMQHALMRMWDAWSAGSDHNRPIDFADFEATGGLGAALSNHADEIYDALPHDRHRSACEKIFKTLTVKGDDNRGIRRPTRLAQLRAIADADRDTVVAVLDAFRGSGVTFLMPGSEVELTDRTVLDLSHESLMRGWQRLRMWVEEEAQSARIFRRLLDTARLWGDGKAGLFRDPDLQIALSWREQEAPNARWAEQYGGDFETAIGFLETSNAETQAERHSKEAARQRELDQARQLAEAQQLRLEQQQRAARRLRLTIAGLAAVAVIAGVACVAALLANQRAITLAVAARQNEEKARQNEEKANQNARRAEESQQETARALATVASQKREVEGSLSKAEAAERLARTEEEKARAAEEEGRKLLYTTDMRLAPFVWRDDRTTAEQLRVLLAKHVPEERRKDEGGRMKGENPAAGESDSSFILHPSSFQRTKSDLRGFEWHYYQHLLKESATVFSGHGDSVVDGAFTANGLLVTLDRNGQLRRWDRSSQAEDRASRRDLPGGPAAQLRVLSTDGRRAALAEGDKVHVFDTSTGDETTSIASSNNQPRRLIFSRDGDRLVIVDDKIRWYHASSGEVIASFDQKFDRLESLALSADGLTLAVVGHAPTAHLFSIFRLNATAKTVAPLAKDAGFGGTMNASALSADGGRIAVGAALAGALVVFDTATGRNIAQHGSAHASPIASMAFSGDGTKLATADAEGTIKIWADPQKLNSKSTALSTLKGHQGAIHRVGFSMDGKRLITASDDKTARVWDLENAGAAIRPLERASYSSVARFSPDGHLIAATNGQSVRLWDAATGRLIRELPPVDKGGVSSVAFSPTDHRLLAVGYGGAADVSHVALWDIDAGTELARLSGATDLPNFQMSPENGVVGALAFSPDGKYLVAGFGSKKLLMGRSSRAPLKVWEVATRRLIRRLDGHTNFCVSLDFSRDGTLLASGSRDGTAILWSTATWKAARTLQNPDTDSVFRQLRLRGMVEDVAFSPDGKTLAQASREGNVQLWDVATGKILETLKGHSSAVLAVAFSPDGRTLASGSTDHTVRLWNVETRRELMQLDPASVELDQVLTLAFSPDGQQLLAGGAVTAFWSTAPIVWNDPGRAAERLRVLLKSNADFPSRIRMLSENLRLHEALAKLDAKDKRVQAALAATQANWHASRKAWPAAVAAFDRLVAADPSGAGAWLRMPGLLRIATALLHQGRPAVAATLLQGAAKRRAQDGLPAVVDTVGPGFAYSAEDETVRVTELLPGFPGSRAGLVPGDTIVKVDDTGLTRESIPKLGALLAGEAGTKVRLTVRHTGSDKPEVIELTRARSVNDPATGELLYPLRAAVDERIAKELRDPGLLELRAEVAGQWSDAKARVADYTAAIAALSQQKPAAQAAELQRLYRRRGDAYVRLQQWSEAVDDYARVVTAATTDDALLENQAMAQANGLWDREATGTWKVLEPTEMKSALGATLKRQGDGSILASGVNAKGDTYTISAVANLDHIGAVRLEALPDASLANRGPGRHPSGNFQLSAFRLYKTKGDGGTARTPLPVGGAWASFDYKSSDADIAGTVDEKLKKVWHVWGRFGEAHEAVFRVGETAAIDRGRPIVIELRHCDVGEAVNLGRFRLSVSEDPASLGREEKLLTARKLTDPWQKLAALYQLKGDRQAIDRLVERRPKLAGPVGDLFIQGKNEEKDWRRAIALYSKGITEKTTDVDVLSKRARAYEALKNWDAAAADWSRAATGIPDGTKLLADFTRRLAAGGPAPLAKGQYEKSRALYERSLAADPENDVVAAELAQLFLDETENESAARWTVLKPTDMKSEGGATLSLLDDGSILASGKNPDRDTYTITARVALDRIRGIRIEALPDASLPLGGPGRFPTNGNFTLHEFRVLSGTKPTALSPLLATYDQFGGFRHIVDGKIDVNAWNVYPQSGRKNTAFLGADFSHETTDELKIGMDFSREGWSGSNLGRFRLSVSGDPATLVREQRRVAAMKLTDPWTKLGAAYVLTGDTQRAADLLAKSGGEAWVAAWLESGLSIDAVLDSMQAKHPEKCATLLSGPAGAAAERGQIDPARTLYTRLAKLQPKNGLWKERAEQLRPGVFAAWYFDHGPEPWKDAHDCEISVKDGVLIVRTTGRDPCFSTPVRGPSGGKAIALRYRTDQAFTMQVFWSDPSGALDDSRHGDYPLPATAGAWREAILPFSSQGTLNLLRLDPNTAPGHPLEMDSILLRELEPGDVGSLPADTALLTRLAAASQAAGRTREAVLFLAKASADDPKDTILSLKVAALQAWFGQEKELADSCRRALEFAIGTSDPATAERAAKSCSLRSTVDKTRLESSLALARKAVEIGKTNGLLPWFQMARGMSEYRSGHFAGADAPLIAAADDVKNNPDVTGPSGLHVTGTSAFYRAMSLFRQGKKDEAQKLATAAAAKMKPLPADEQNPLAGDATHDDLILWLAYKEAKAMIHFDTAPAAPGTHGGK